MIAINHAMTGAIIGLVVSQPLLAIPLAFLSHFLLDAVPHFDQPGGEEVYLRKQSFVLQLILDAFLCAVLVATLFLANPSNRLLASVCAFLATSADFMWLPTFWRLKHGQQLEWPNHPLARLHTKVQWFSKPIGGFIELIWAVGCLLVLEKLI